MRTVADFISAGASLRVVCRNCGRHGDFTARFLKARLGYTGDVFKARFRCGGCQSYTVSLAAAAPALAERKELPHTAAFGGVYAKYLK